LKSARLVTAVLVFALALMVLGPPASAGPLGGLGIGPGAPRTADFTLGGTPCRLIAVPAAAPVGTGSCPGVRPGAIVLSDVGQCTFNFVYSGSDGRTYIGTAGHCINADGQERSWAPGAGPVARDSDGNRIGEFAYAVLQDPKDIALIRVDPGVPVNPQMCHFGGPTGINSDTPGLGAVVLQHYGNGVGVGLVLPARSAVALGMPDPDHVYAEGLVVPGDSGSGIETPDGRAVGVIVTVGLHLASLGSGGIDAGTMGVTRLAPQLARATQVTGVTYTIVTAPTL
jgi:hypothetical protein